jgi:hypothetical protein
MKGPNDRVKEVNETIRKCTAVILCYNNGDEEEGSRRKRRGLGKSTECLWLRVTKCNGCASARLRLVEVLTFVSNTE